MTGNSTIRGRAFVRAPPLPDWGTWVAETRCERSNNGKHQWLRLRAGRVCEACLRVEAAEPPAERERERSPDEQKKTERSESDDGEPRRG